MLHARIRRLCGLVVILGVSLVASAQQDYVWPTGTGLISGQLVDAVSGAPVPGVVLHLTVADFRFPAFHDAGRTYVTTDEDGRFELAELAPGLYRLSTTGTQSGYVGSFGATRTFGPGQVIELRDGERLTDLVYETRARGRITGQVLTESGRPRPGVPVMVLRVSWLSGSEFYDKGRPVRSGPDGRYQVPDLYPADYIVATPAPASASASGRAPLAGAAARFVTAYHPSTFDPTAARHVTVRPGETVGGIDLRWPGGEGHTVSGTIAGATGGRIELVRADAPAATSMPVTTTFADATGAFVLHGVPPGDYRLRFTSFPEVRRGQGNVIVRQQGGGLSASYRPSTAEALRAGTQVPDPLPPVGWRPTLYVDAPLRVGTEDISDLVFEALEAGRISGRVRFEDGTSPAPSELLAFPVVVMSADRRELDTFTAARIEEDGTFETAGLPPGRYFVHVAPPVHIMLSTPWRWPGTSVAVDGRPADGTALQLGTDGLADVDISLTTTSAKLVGQVADETGTVRPDATVFVIPVNEEAWQGLGRVPGGHGGPNELRARTSGRYEALVRPGEYYVLARTGTVDDDWRDPDTLAEWIQSALRVRVPANTTVEQDLSIARR